MPWDTIPPARYQTSSHLQPFIAQLQQQHEARAAKDPDFIYTLARINLDAEIRAQQTVPLNEAKRKQRQDDYEARLLALENQRLTARGEEPLSTLENRDPLLEPDHSEEEENQAQDDAFLVETSHILLDLLQLEHQVATVD